MKVTIVASSYFHTPGPDHDLHHHIPLVVRTPCHDLERLLCILQREPVCDEAVDVQLSRAEQGESFRVGVATVSRTSK